MITTNTLNTFWKDYTPHTVGLDDVFHRLEAMSGNNVNYPPYNLIKHDSSNFSIEIALAGFKPTEVEVSTEQNVLRVASKVEKRDTERTYLYKGLSKRSFIRNWQLADDVEIKNVKFEDGLLVINLQRIIPEKQQRKVYEIASSEKQLLTE
ncbi:heat shock protein [Synechococcus phage S-CREM1]|nr:heat shock protein [Synechococcus phage S-CREM1]